MAKRPAYTLLFIRHDLLVRADFGPFPHVPLLGFWQRQQSGNARLYYSIEAAMNLGGKCGNTVWVIGEEFWTQTLSLPASAMAGLGREQIEKTIGFDVEALTGIAGSDSALGFTAAGPTDESEHFWVTQIATAPRAQIQKSIEAAGGVLGGLVHPGGLPTPVDPNVGSNNINKSWRRIEVWKDTTLCIIGKPNQPRRIKVINGDPGQEAWRTTVTRWTNANDAELSEWLGPQGSMAGQSLTTTAKPWTALPALADDVLKGWLGRWALELADGAKNVPVVAPEHSAALKRPHIVAAAVLAAVCLVCCCLHALWMNQRETAAIHDRDLAEAPRREFASLDKQAGTLRAELARQEAKNANTRQAVRHDPRDVDRQHYRLEGLLGALADDADGNLVIDRISTEAAGAVLIEGECQPATAVDDFTRRLAAVLPGRGWDIAPAQKSQPSGSSDVGPCEFRLRVAPWSAGGASTTPAIPASGRHGGGQ